MTRAAKITSLVAAVIFTAVFVIIWPGSMLSGEQEYIHNIDISISKIFLMALRQIHLHLQNT